MRAVRLRRHPRAEAEDTMDVIVGLIIMYFALMIFPVILKLFGLRLHRRPAHQVDQ
jgi:hypothetical protein